MKSYTVPNRRPYMEGRCYLLACEKTGAAAVIDPDGCAADVQALLKKQHLSLKMILLTHGHFDHIGSVDELRAAQDVPVYIHPLDAALLTAADGNLSSLLGAPLVIGAADALLHDGDTLLLGDTPIQVLHTPGHTPGSCCFFCGGALYSGDLLFCGGVGRTDLPGGDAAQLQESLARVLELPPDTPVYPGHGPSTTIGNEAGTLYDEG
ncbi:MAG: MBL fold metallo-hydrolase [Eubacteriales bacterium]|nr:MBL fold metallo-hydrolase [Eubacteriales bacterium]